MKEVIVLIPFYVVGLLIDIWFFTNEFKGKMIKATILKGCASLIFVSMGIFCYIKHPTDSAILILIGLTLGLFGDVLINLRDVFKGPASNKIFAIGILAFLSGHFMYIAFMSKQAMSQLLLTAILTLVIAAIFIPLILKHVIAPSKGIKIFGCVYLLIVIAMFSFSVGQIVSVGTSRVAVLMLIGAFLFMVSDFVMIYNSFGKKQKPLRVLNLLAYYVGQLIIATSILYL